MTETSLAAVILPSPEPDLYPVHCGPVAFYPAEASVPPVWQGGESRNPFVATGDWLGYFRARIDQHEAENRAEPQRPPAEHTTAVPWPEGFAVPGGAKRVQGRAEAAGWAVRAGYSRAYRKSVGRGIYRLHHYVRVQARRDGREVWAMWCAPVEQGGRLEWKSESAQVNGWPAGVKDVEVAITAAAAPAV